MKFVITWITPLFSVALLSACVSADVLESATSSSAPSAPVFAAAPPLPAETAQIDNVPSPTAIPLPALAPSSGDTLAMVDPYASQQNKSALGAQDFDGMLQPPVVRGPAKTYLINGLLSAVPFIGYGFRNLNKKMPEAKLYSYMGVVEGPAAIAPAVIKEAEAAWRADPTTRINLIGISLGADLITVIAQKLNARGVPVAYLGIVDGTNLRPIPANVAIADNLTCSYLDCTKARAKLAKGNSTTQLTRKVYRSSHIPLGDNDELHAHVIARSR